MELSKYFGIMALVLVSLGRVFSAKYLDCFPVVAPFMYPIMSLTIYNKFGAFVIGMITQLYISKVVLEGFGTETDGKPETVNHDYIITLALGCVLFGMNMIVPYMGLDTKKRDGMQKVNE